jgi:3-oxoacyl-[acyl-carrier protein] reductase
MELGLSGRRVLVTGAAGGIGTAICRGLADEGAHLAVHHRRSAEAAERLAEEVGGVAVRADLRDGGATEAMVGRAAAELGGLDALVANAGVWPTPPTPLWELDETRWRETIEVDLTGTFLTLRAFLRQLAGRSKDAPPPGVVLIGSTAGRFGEAGHADYAAAKSGVQVGLLRSLKNEIVRLHPAARANAVAPGWTVTPMTAETLDEATRRHATATVPLEKVGTPEDVASATAWLLSERVAGHVTGEVVTVAGGMEGRLLNP